MEQKENNSPQRDTNTDKKDENSTKNKEDDNVVEYSWGRHPNSIKALQKHQYPKGVSGNVLGRKPTFEVLGKHLQKLGEEVTYNYHKESQGSRKEQVLKRIWFDAIRGDWRKIQLLAWLGCLD